MRTLTAAPTALLTISPAPVEDTVNVALVIQADGETVLTAPVANPDNTTWLLFGALPNALFEAAEALLAAHGWRPVAGRRWVGGGGYDMQVRVEHI